MFATPSSYQLAIKLYYYYFEVINAACPFEKEQAITSGHAAFFLENNKANLFLLLAANPLVLDLLWIASKYNGAAVTQVWHQ